MFRIRKPDVRDVSGMLVERVFLVSGVVKLFFHLTKKIREVFSFFTTNKKSKADFVGISKSPLFVGGVVKTMFYGEHDENTLFSTENTRDTGHNFWRTCSLLFFLFAGENSMRTYFFYSREKILCVGFPYFLSFVKKKGFQKTLFEIRKRGENPPFRTNIYI